MFQERPPEGIPGASESLKVSRTSLDNAEHKPDHEESAGYDTPGYPPPLVGVLEMEMSHRNGLRGLGLG